MPPSAKLSSYVLHYENLFCERVSRDRDYAYRGIAIGRHYANAVYSRFVCASAAGTLTVLEIEPWPPCVGQIAKGEKRRYRSTVSYKGIPLVSTFFLLSPPERRKSPLSLFHRGATSSKNPPF